MSRYIDVDELLTRLPDDLPYKASVKRVLTQAPTADVVEVVRCKDCQLRYVPYRCALWYASANDKAYFAERGPYFYCSYGERKANDDIDQIADEIIGGADGKKD